MIIFDNYLSYMEKYLLFEEEEQIIKWWYYGGEVFREEKFV